LHGQLSITNIKTEKTQKSIYAKTFSTGLLTKLQHSE